MGPVCRRRRARDSHRCGLRTRGTSRWGHMSLTPLPPLPPRRLSLMLRRIGTVSTPSTTRTLTADSDAQTQIHRPCPSVSVLSARCNFSLTHARAYLCSFAQPVPIAVVHVSCWLVSGAKGKGAGTCSYKCSCTAEVVGWWGATESCDAEQHRISALSVSMF
jgi:hypothetical protein